MTEVEQKKVIKIFIEGIGVGYSYGFRDGKDESLNPIERCAKLQGRTLEELTYAFKNRPCEQAIEIAKNIENIWNNVNVMTI